VCEVANRLHLIAMATLHLAVIHDKWEKGIAKRKNKNKKATVSVASRFVRCVQMRAISFGQPARNLFPLWLQLLFGTQDR